MSLLNIFLGGGGEFEVDSYGEIKQLILYGGRKSERLAFRGLNFGPKQLRG